VDAVRNGGLDLNGNPPVVSTLLDGELAHALRVQAALELRMGNNAGAQAAAEKALYIITAHPDLPLAWRADIVALMGEINARQGRVVQAERNYTDALAMDRKLFGEGGPTIQALLQLGRFYSDEQIYPSSIASYREAFAMLAKNPLARRQVVADQIVPFLAAANASLGGPDRARLEGERRSARPKPPPWPRRCAPPTMRCAPATKPAWPWLPSAPRPTICAMPSANWRCRRRWRRRHRAPIPPAPSCMPISPPMPPWPIPVR
jgi:tetratricopeptide (TPR) repeat protein